jgi:transmembrane sensor
MNRSAQNPLERIHYQAARWVAEGDVASLPPEMQCALQKWRNRSPLHNQAYEEKRNLWRAADAICTCSDFDHEGTKRRRPLRLPAAMLIGASLLIGGALELSVEHTTYTTSSYVTDADGPRTITLADGSSVELGPNTRLTVHFGKHVRAIYLMNGSGLFRVAHEPDRPFDVIAGHHTVRAKGTEFSVIVVGGDRPLDLLVVSGAVVLDPQAVRPALLGSAADDLRTFGPGDHVVLKSGAITRTTLTQDDIARELLWRKSGEILFDGTQVDDAIATINRFNRVQIYLHDPVAARQRIGGAFRLNDVERFASGISFAVGLRITKSPSKPNEIHLVRDESVR